jgi:RNA polymerase sigma-70 factor (ECF subfamily)
MTQSRSPADPSDGQPSSQPDESAGPGLAQLFEDHNAMLIHLLRTKLNSDQEARDVAQEAYVRMLQLDRIGTVSYLRAYLFRTALNIATDRLRTNGVRRAVHRDLTFLGNVDEISPERTAAATDELAAVRRAIQTLPPKVREAFTLHSFGELDFAEIARRMRMSERSVRNYIADALVCCRQAIDDSRGRSRPAAKKPTETGGRS